MKDEYRRFWQYCLYFLAYLDTKYEGWIQRVFDNIAYTSSRIPRHKIRKIYNEGWIQGILAILLILLRIPRHKIWRIYNEGWIQGILTILKWIGYTFVVGNTRILHCQPVDRLLQYIYIPVLFWIKNLVNYWSNEPGIYELISGKST